MGITKRQKVIQEKVELGKLYPLKEAIELLKLLSTVKFKESIDISLNLGVNPQKAEQIVRGSTVLPNGTGRKVRVAVFADGEAAQQAKAAGADKVGLEDLAASIKKGELDFTVAIATPAAMRVVGRLGPILGPRGLMPNPKVGTVTADVKRAVENAKAGQVQYRTDKNGIIHCPVGKVDFAYDALKENVKTLVADIKKAKPIAAKGTYLKKITLSSTMGPGLEIDIATIEG